MKEIPMGKQAFPVNLSPLLLKNLLTSFVIYVDKSLVGKSRFLEALLYLIGGCFVVLLRLLRSLLPCFKDKSDRCGAVDAVVAPAKIGQGSTIMANVAADSAIGRALSQLLCSLNEIPVSSRKYEMVRSLVEKLIQENWEENAEVLNEVNHAVLSTALSRTLGFLEAIIEGKPRDSTVNSGPVRAIFEKAVVGWRWPTKAALADRAAFDDGAAEKLAAEIMWLAQKLVDCGFGEDSIRQWANAKNLALLALDSEPRLQVWLVKVSAFLLKELKWQAIDEGKTELHREITKKMLVSWLPLLCRASNGTDMPILSASEREQVEKQLQDMVENLGEEDDQEEVLSLWLQHFTFCTSSDWPNLYPCFAKWCSASRKQLIH